MKNKNLLLILLVIAAGFASYYLVTKTQHTRQPETSVASPTVTSSPSPSPVATGFSAEVKARVRSEFLTNCHTKGHYSVTECTCAAEYLASNYSEAEIEKIYIQYRTSDEVPSALEDARNACVK